MTLLDGSCGSKLWALADESGIENVPTWIYNIEHPELVTKMHKQYIEAGSDMIQTNTFAVNSMSVKRYPQYTVEQIVTAAVKLAKEAVKGTDVKVYLSSGPLAMLLEPYGDLEEDECRQEYETIVGAAKDAGAEAIMLETFMDLEMMKIASSEALKTGLPVSCSMTFEARMHTIMGNSVESICSALSDTGISAIGMNCSKGPVDGLEVIKEYKKHTDLPLYFKPNAGMGEKYSAEQFAREMQPSLEFVSYIGGCCGTDENYIKELKKLL